MTTKPFKVAVIQHACSDKPGENLQRSVTGIEQAGKQGAELVLLQELHRSHYFCVTQNTHHFSLAESIPGPTTEQLCELAKTQNLVLIASIFEKRSAGLYHNTAVAIDRNGEIAGQYRKMHIPDDPGYNEKFYFTPGDQGFIPIETSLAKLGILICWDQWFPEAARLMTLAGAELLCYPTAIGWDPQDDGTTQQQQLDAWLTIQRSHAIANGLPVLCANRCGFEPDPSQITHGSHFWGNSFICGPQGEALAQLNGETNIAIATIDPQHNEQIRQIWPYLRDRRIDAYQSLLKRWDD